MTNTRNTQFSNDKQDGSKQKSVAFIVYNLAFFMMSHVTTSEEAEILMQQL